MSALDKLNAKANITATKEDDKVVQNKSVQKKQTNKQPVKEKKATVKVETPAKKKIVQETPKTEKHAGGRKNTRGTNGKDYKMMNIAVPMDVYEKLKEASNGNMTFYINSVLKSSVQ